MLLLPVATITSAALKWFSSSQGPGMYRGLAEHIGLGANSGYKYGQQTTRRAASGTMTLCLNENCTYSIIFYWLYDT